MVPGRPAPTPAGGSCQSVSTKVLSSVSSDFAPLSLTPARRSSILRANACRSPDSLCRRLENAITDDAKIVPYIHARSPSASPSHKRPLALGRPRCEIRRCGAAEPNRVWQRRPLGSTLDFDLRRCVGTKEDAKARATNGRLVGLESVRGERGLERLERRFWEVW